MSKQKVLFVCIHNSARSQMAEEMLRKFAGDQFETESAGIEPGKVNPLVAQVLKEDEGIDISSKPTNAVADFIKEGRTYDYIVTVCDEASAQRCPVFPGRGTRLHWGFPDPSTFEGSDADKLARVRVVKASIEKQLQEWLATV